jgi:hypothetical protein
VPRHDRCAPAAGNKEIHDERQRRSIQGQGGRHQAPHLHKNRYRSGRRKHVRHIACSKHPIHHRGRPRH